jgi:hypothetical protein
MYKIIGADQKEYGPVTADQVRQWLAEGRANLQTKVLAEGATEWKAIGELPEFAGAAPGPAPIAPMMAAPSAGAADQVNGPAIGLLVTAILNVVAQPVFILMRLAGVTFAAANQMPRDQAAIAAFSGVLGIVFGIIATILGVVVLIGALKMKKLQSYGFAMTASIIAMLPCIFPCCLLGLPMGIWALVVLAKPEVKSAFH